MSKPAKDKAKMPNLAEEETRMPELVEKETEEAQTLDTGAKGPQMPDSSGLTALLQLPPAVSEEAKQLSPAIVEEVKQLSTAVVEEVKQLSTAIVEEIQQLSYSVEKEVKRITIAFEEAIDRLCMAVENAVEQLSSADKEVKRLPTTDKVGESSSLPPPPSVEVELSYQRPSAKAEGSAAASPLPSVSGEGERSAAASPLPSVSEAGVFAEDLYSFIWNAFRISPDRIPSVGTMYENRARSRFTETIGIAVLCTQIHIRVVDRESMLNNVSATRLEFFTHAVERLNEIFTRNMFLKILIASAIIAEYVLAEYTIGRYEFLAYGIICWESYFRYYLRESFYQAGSWDGLAAYIARNEFVERGRSLVLAFCSLPNPFDPVPPSWQQFLLLPPRETRRVLLPSPPDSKRIFFPFPQQSSRVSLPSLLQNSLFFAGERIERVRVAQKPEKDSRKKRIAQEPEKGNRKEQVAQKPEKGSRKKRGRRLRPPSVAEGKVRDTAAKMEKLDLAAEMVMAGEDTAAEGLATAAEGEVSPLAVDVEMAMAAEVEKPSNLGACFKEQSSKLRSESLQSQELDEGDVDARTKSKRKKPKKKSSRR